MAAPSTQKDIRPRRARRGRPPTGRDPTENLSVTVEQYDAIEALAVVQYQGNISAVMRDIVREWLEQHSEWRKDAERRLKSGQTVTAPRSGMTRLVHADEEHVTVAFSLPIVERNAIRLAATEAGIEKASYYRANVIAAWVTTHRREIKRAQRRIEAGERAASVEGSTRTGRREAVREMAKCMLSGSFLPATGHSAAAA